MVEHKLPIPALSQKGEAEDDKCQANLSYTVKLRNPGQGREGKRLGEREEENGLFTSLLP